MEKTLGILGGMGPLATSYFYNMIVTSTLALKDQEHINMIIINDVLIPDRTSFILGKGNNPLPRLILDIKKLETLNVDLIAIPCNTCMYFYDSLSNSTNIKILNIVLETVNYLKSINSKKVYLVATKGTIESGIYQRILEENNIEYVLPENIDEIMFLIYERVKSGKKISKSELKCLYNHYDEVDNIILGCTELSIIKGMYNLDNKFIDPLEIERDIILKYFDKEKKMLA